MGSPIHPPIASISQQAAARLQLQHQTQQRVTSSVPLSLYETLTQVSAALTRPSQTAPDRPPDFPQLPPLYAQPSRPSMSGQFQHGPSSQLQQLPVSSAFHYVPSTSHRMYTTAPPQSAPPPRPQTSMATPSQHAQMLPPQTPMTIPSQHAQMLPPQSSLARPPQYGPLPSQVPPYPPPPYGATRTTTYYWPQQYEQRQPQYVHRPQATYAQAVRHQPYPRPTQMQPQQWATYRQHQFVQPRPPPPLQQGVSQLPAQQVASSTQTVQSQAQQSTTQQPIQQSLQNPLPVQQQESPQPQPTTSKAGRPGTGARKRQVTPRRKPTKQDKQPKTTKQNPVTEGPLRLDSYEKYRADKENKLLRKRVNTTEYFVTPDVVQDHNHTNLLEVQKRLPPYQDSTQKEKQRRMEIEGALQQQASEILASAYRQTSAERSRYAISPLLPQTTPAISYQTKAWIFEHARSSPVPTDSDLSLIQPPAQPAATPATPNTALVQSTSQTKNSASSSTQSVPEHTVIESLLAASSSQSPHADPFVSDREREKAKTTADRTSYVDYLQLVYADKNQSAPQSLKLAATFQADAPVQQVAATQQQQQQQQQQHTAATEHSPAELSQQQSAAPSPTTTEQQRERERERERAKPSSP